jgi:hypothetical protein
MLVSRPNFRFYCLLFAQGCGECVPTLSPQPLSCHPRRYHFHPGLTTATAKTSPQLHPGLFNGNGSFNGAPWLVWSAAVHRMGLVHSTVHRGWSGPRQCPARGLVHGPPIHRMGSTVHRMTGPSVHRMGLVHSTVHHDWSGPQCTAWDWSIHSAP